MLNLAVSLWSERNRPWHRFSRLLGIASLLPLLQGCSLSDGSAPGDSGSTTSVGEGGSSGDGDSQTHDVIRFSETTTLELSPSGVAAVSVQVRPPRRQTVVFEILSQGSSFDGYLAGNSIRVDDEGKAVVEIHAPSERSEFEIRASLSSGAETRRRVHVSDQGFGKLTVVPIYEGYRTISNWHASAFPGRRCDELDSWFVDGQLTGEGVNSVEINDVPAGTLFAVTVRGNKLVGNCQTVMDLSTDEELKLTITAMDRPLSDQGGALRLSFGVDAATSEFAALLDAAITDSAAAFLSDLDADASALLSSMRAELPASARAPYDELIDDELTLAVEAALDSPTAISDRIRSILTGASVRIAGDHALEAELELNGLKSELEVTTAGGIDAERAGFRVEEAFQFEVETGDAFALGGEIIYDPVLWLAELAEDQAEKDETMTPVQAIIDAAHCEEVTATILAATDSGELIGCSADCLFEACEAQAETVWGEIKMAGQSTTLLVGASGAATAQGNAVVGRLTGTWVGKTGGSTTSLKGLLKGVAK